MSLPLTRPVLHDPDAVLPYRMDWTAWLAAEGDTFAGSPGIDVTPVSSPAPGSPAADLTVAGSPAPAYSGGYVVWWLTDGIPGQEYQVRVRIATTAGRRDDRTVTVRVQER